MYKLCPTHPIFGASQSVIRISDNASIPADEANTDYQAFLKYQAEGGVVLPADNNEQTA